MPLPQALADHPRLDQWVRFPAPGRVWVATGKVEIGQGVLTAMRQIAAEELDVAPDRIDLYSGDTALTPNEGYTAGSQSIQFGGVALQLACAEVRARFIDRAAEILGHAAADLRVEDGAILHRGAATGEDYWSLAAGVDLARPATGAAPIKPPARRRLVGRNLPRTDLAAKLFGEPVFAHDMTLPGMVHARVVRPPSYGATLVSVDTSEIEKMPGVVKVVIRLQGNWTSAGDWLQKTAVCNSSKVTRPVVP